MIVHSANDGGANGMFWCLRRAGWPVVRVRPHDQHAWVETHWAAMLDKLIAAGWIAL